MLAKILITLYIVKQNGENILDEKDAKITKQSHAYKGYANTYSVKMLTFFNPQLQLKDAESAIKNKLMDTLSELRRFKFVAALVLKFNKT